jgi:hypothetical protein
MYKAYNLFENGFRWQLLVPTTLAGVLGLFWIIFLFPEWKKDFIMVIFLLLAVIIVLGGVFSICSGVLLARKVNWQIESGVVVSSYIQKVGRESPSISVPGGPPTIWHQPYVVCKYNILGKEYSKAMMPSAAANTAREAQAILNKFPVGKEFDFFYDPKHPENAVIEIPSVFSRMLAFLIGLILTSGGLFIGWILMVNLYNYGKVDISDIFRVPVRLEYQVTRVATQIFKLPETEQEKLESYMRYLGSINDYIENRGNYSSFYTRERVINEQINTMKRLIEITQNNPDNLFSWGEELFDILDRNDRLDDARAILIKIRDKYPEQFNASYLKNKLAIDSAGSK